MKTLIAIIILAIGGYFLYTLSTGFSADQIEQVKRSIKEEYEKSGDRTVQEVSLLRKSSHELTGFVRVKHTKLSIDQTLECTATMDQAGGRYLWRCGR